MLLSFRLVRLTLFCVVSRVLGVELGHSIAAAFAAKTRACWREIEIVAGHFVSMFAVGLVVNSALSVHLNRDSFQVERIAAVANVAQVVNFVSFGNRAYVVLIGKPVRA
jgi:hypothetical protein